MNFVAIKFVNSEVHNVIIRKKNATSIKNLTIFRYQVYEVYDVFNNRTKDKKIYTKTISETFVGKYLYLIIEMKM